MLRRMLVAVLLIVLTGSFEGCGGDDGTVSQSSWMGTFTQIGLGTYPMDLEIAEQSGINISGKLIWTDGPLGIKVDTQTRFIGTLMGNSVYLNENEFIQGNGVAIPTIYNGTIVGRNLSGSAQYGGSNVGSFQLTRSN